MKNRIRTIVGGLVSAAAVVGSASAAVTPGAENLVTGTALLGEIEALHSSLMHITTLLGEADIPDDSEVMAKTAKLVRRVRSLVYATNAYQMNERERKVAARQEAHRELMKGKREQLRQERRAESNLRERRATAVAPALRGGIGSGAVVVEEEAREEERGVTDLTTEQERQLEEQVEEELRAVDAREVQPEALDDEGMKRHLYDSIITFPECKELFLEDCFAVLNQQLLELKLTADFIVHEKRNMNQENYNKVVIVTDMTATLVKGRDNDGRVFYPFMWNEVVNGVPVGFRMLGVNGEWDCHDMTPEDCCDVIKASAPNPDVNGNMIQCHIFVPYGGVGNEKRGDRVFINLSPDGRVHEAPFVA